MFSLLPPLLALSGLAAILLRVTLGLVFILWASKRFKAQASTQAKFKACAEGIVGLLLILGLFTQLVALIAVIFFGVKLFRKIKAGLFLTDGVNYYFILLVVALSLLFTGPGYIAFDLPL